MSFIYAINNEISYSKDLLVHQNRENAQLFIGDARDCKWSAFSGKRRYEEEEVAIQRRQHLENFNFFNFRTLCPFLASEDLMLFDDMLCLEWSAFSFQEKRGGGRGWRPEQPTNYFSPRSDLPWRAVA